MYIHPDAEPVKLREHLARLWRLAAREFDCEGSPFSYLGWSAVYVPLHVATSINSVSTDTSFVDEFDSIFWCSAADEYESARSTLLSEYVKDLTVFTWTWTALEQAIRLVTEESNLAPIEAAASLIDQYAESLELCGFDETVTSVYEGICSLLGDNIVTKIHVNVKNGNWLAGPNVLFLYICRQARNFFIHEAKIEIEPEKWRLGPAPKIEPKEVISVVNLLTRSSLFAIQLLLLLGFDSS